MMLASSFVPKKFHNTHLVVVSALRQVRVCRWTRLLDAGENCHLLIKNVLAS